MSVGEHVNPSPGQPWYRDLGRPQWLTLAGAWALWLLDAFDFLLITFVLVDIAKSFDVSLKAASLLLISTYGVRWLGGLLFGALSDKIGRKIPLLIALTWFTTATALTGISWSYLAIFAFRIFLGFGMAPIISLASTMIVESWPDHRRAIGIGLLDTAWGLGNVLAAATYAFVYPSLGWRSMFFVGIVPGILLWGFIWKFVPESPVWLRNRRAATASGAKQGSSIVALFRDHPGKLVALCSMQLCVQFGSWPIQGLLPTLLREKHLEPHMVGVVTSCGAVGQVFGFFASGFIAERLGRRNAILLMLALGCASAAAVIAETNVIALAIPFSFLTGFFLIGAAGIYPTVIAENLPVHVRATGVGFIYNIGIIGSASAPFVVLASLDALHIVLTTGMTFWTIVGNLIGVAIMFLFVRETKGALLNDAEDHDAIMTGGH